MDPAARRLGPIRDHREVWKSSPQRNARVRGGQGLGDARQVSTATPSQPGRRACAERTDRIGVRPVDTLPGGLNSLKSKRTDRV